jgi:preprotein translocase subunit YajC
MRDSLKKGDVITSIGGIVGKIVSVTKDTIVIETSEDRVRMELTKWAVSTVGVQTSEQADNSNAKKADKQEAAELPEEPVDEIPTPETENTEDKS